MAEGLDNSEVLGAAGPTPFAHCDNSEEGALAVLKENVPSSEFGKLKNSHWAIMNVSRRSSNNPIASVDEYQRFGDQSRDRSLVKPLLYSMHNRLCHLTLWVSGSDYLDLDRERLTIYTMLAKALRSHKFDRVTSTDGIMCKYSFDVTPSSATCGEMLVLRACRSMICYQEVCACCAVIIYSEIGLVVQLSRLLTLHFMSCRSKMSTDEALIFKQFDSKKDGRARQTPHCAFQCADDHGPTRQSIEVRCLEFWEGESVE